MTIVIDDQARRAAHFRVGSDAIGLVQRLRRPGSFGKGGPGREGD